MKSCDESLAITNDTLSVTDSHYLMIYKSSGGYLNLNSKIITFSFTFTLCP